MKPRMRNRAALAAILAALLAAAPAPAQESPLAGKTVEFLSGYSDGAALNTLLQEFARAMERAQPGLRVVFRVNPGGTSALNMAMIAEAAPDGLTIGTVDFESLISKARGEVQYDITDFELLGNIDRSISVLLASSASGISSIADLIGADRNFALPVRGTTSATYYLALMINAFLGTRILPVTGYDAGARTLAFISGEAPIASLGQSSTIQVIADGVGRTILNATGGDMPPEYGEAPDLDDFPGNAEFEWIKTFLTASSHTLVIGTRRGAPSEILAALRQVFLKALDDPHFREVASELADLDPTPGEDVERLVANFAGEGIDLAARFDRVIACGLQLAETGLPCS